MKTLYVHIGTKKTGTASIQRFCMANQKQLEEKGYCYPVFSFDYYRVMEKRNGHFLVGSLWDGEGNHDREKEQKYFREGMNRVKDLFQEFDGVILSDEQIWKNTYEERAGLWEELKEEGKMSAPCGISQ